MSENSSTRRALRPTDYQELVEQVPAIMYMAERGASGRWFYVSPQIEQILGFTPKEWISDPGLWRKQLHPEDLERALAAEQSLSHVGDSYRAEYRLFARDGREIWVRDEATYVREGQTGAMVMRGLFTDITERKRSEEERRQIEEQLQKILGNAPIVLFALDNAGVFTLSAGSGLKDLGLKPGEAVGHSVFDLYRSNPDILSHVRGALQGQEFTAIDDVSQAGRIFQTRWAPAVDSTGRQTGVIGVAVDITEIRKSEEALRRSEERYRIFLTQSSEGIFRVEYTPLVPTSAPASEQVTLSLSSGRIAECNDALARMYGFRLALEMVGKRLGELPSADAFVREFVSNGYRLSGFQEERAREDGKPGIFQTTMIGIVEDGHLARTWAIQRDVTERVRLEEQLRSIQQLEAIGRLAGGVAHDFNNLLGVILGHAQLVQEKTENSEHAKAGLSHIRRAAEQAASLTQRLLAFSRKQVLRPRILDLNEIVVEMQKMLSRVIGEDIELVTHLHPSLAGVKADRSQLEQVLMNLVINARDAMPQGGRLRMETANVEIDEAFARKNPGMAPGRHVLLTVTDTGHGMDAETLEHAFEPFFTTKEAGKGTGLGLATVYGIVKQSEGHIAVSSEVGKGTCFHIYLPAETGLSLDQVEEVAADVQGGNETILIVEDQAELREVTRIFLESYGYYVLEASDAAEALRLAGDTSTTIDLILTDVIMPGLSGRQLVEQVQNIRPKIKVIYMTGYTDDMVVHHKVLEPGVALLQKPFLRLELVRKVRTILDHA